MQLIGQWISDVVPQHSQACRSYVEEGAEPVGTLLITVFNNGDATTATNLDPIGLAVVGRTVHELYQQLKQQEAKVEEKAEVPATPKQTLH